MIIGIYSIKDVVAGQFGKIDIMSNDEVAKRNFALICSKNEIRNDLQLYKLGSYNIETGEILSKVEYICGGADNVEV